MHVLNKADNKKGLALQTLSNKIDWLLLMLDQMENKLSRKTADCITIQLEGCREKILGAGRDMIQLNETVVFIEEHSRLPIPQHCDTDIEKGRTTAAL